jgi:hypothetical protein
VTAPPFPLVLVEWSDSHVSNAWESLAGFKDECEGCQSVGYLVHDGAAAKVIAPHVAAPGGLPHGNGLITIPAGAVRRIVPLVEGEADATA